MPKGLDALSAEPKAFYDFGQLNELRARTHDQSLDSLKESARQFESLFIKMMIKSMRDATPGEELLESDSSRLYQDMFDEQIAVNLASQGSFGLADMLIKQMTQGQGVMGTESSKRYFNRNNIMLPVDATPATIKQYIQSYERIDRVDQPLSVESVTQNTSKATDSISMFANSDEFVSQLWPMAEGAGKKLGLGAEILLAQAALETGWGRSMSLKKNGAPSYNLFNIKANSEWKGERAYKETSEFRDGGVEREVATFRAYDSFGESFNDYVKFVRQSPRYQEALQHGGDPLKYISALQEAGYATDPSYAAKIANIMTRDTISSISSRYASAE